MTANTRSPAPDDIARVAYTIWESEGRPEGRDHEHWMRARQLLEEGGTEADLAPPPGEDVASEPRPVQPGFKDTAPGLVPIAKPHAGADLQEEPGGRFAKQLADLPGTANVETPGSAETPGPRNPPPIAAANAEGYATVPSNEDAGAAAMSDDPTPPPVKPAGNPGRT